MPERTAEKEPLSGGERLLLDKYPGGTFTVTQADYLAFQGEFDNLCRKGYLRASNLNHPNMHSDLKFTKRE